MLTSHARSYRCYPLLECIHRALPALYLVWALPFLLTLAWLVPPWSHPDEPNHMLRIVELAHGELLGERLGPRDAGGLTDVGVADAAAPFASITFHAERKVTRPVLSASDRVPWRGSLSLLGFPNTAPYPPLFYLPAMAAVRIAQMVGLHVNRTLYLARAATALATVLVNAAALVFARRTRYALAGLAMLPMTCSLDASASQDALIIALSLLAVGWIDSLIERNQPASWTALAGLVLALVAIGMARPPYVVLAVLLLLVTPRLGWSTVAGACIVVAGVGAWSALAAATVLVARGDPSVQAELLLSHPLQSVTILLTTLHREGPGYAVQFIGQLGWLDTALPRWYIVLALAAIVSGFAAAIDGPSRRPWLPVLAAVGGSALIFGTQYLSWTQPGADAIEGVQGRYFIPLAAALALSVPGLPRFGPLIRPVALAGLGILGVTTPFVVVQALVVRYYLSG